MHGGCPGFLSLGEGPRMQERLSVVSPKPRQVQHATALLFLIISLYRSTWALLGVTGVAQRLFYHVCFDSAVSGVAVVGGTFGMVTDGVNVLSVRSRTTRSSKGKVCPIPYLPFSHSNIILILPPFVSPPLYPPPACAFCPRPLHPFPPTALIAPLRPRSKHTATHGATSSARSLRGRHNRRRKLPFPRAFRPTVWHRVPSSPATQGYL